jgi:hypothetical protein
VTFEVKRREIDIAAAIRVPLRTTTPLFRNHPIRFTKPGGIYKLPYEG